MFDHHGNTRVCFCNLYKHLAADMPVYPSRALSMVLLEHIENKKQTEISDLICFVKIILITY